MAKLITLATWPYVQAGLANGAYSGEVDEEDDTSLQSAPDLVKAFETLARG